MCKVAAVMISLHLIASPRPMVAAHELEANIGVADLKH